MEQPSTAKKRAGIFTVIAAFLLGAIVGAAGYAGWTHLRPRPIFSFDPGKITEMTLQGKAALGGTDGNVVTIIDRERIEYVAELLNDFPCHSTMDAPPASGWDSRLGLYTGNGITWVYFGTFDNGEPDYVRIYEPDSSSTVYFTTPGYFWELTKMGSSTPSGKMPESPGTTAAPTDS